MELSQRQKEPHLFRLVTGGQHCDCKDRLAFKEEGNLLLRAGQAPPPMWTGPTPVKAAQSPVGNKKVLEEMWRIQKEGKGTVAGLTEGSVKTTPQMTRFRDAQVCNNMATI